MATTDRTQQIAEDITSILDYLSRVLQGAEEGNIHYLHDKAGQLANAARRLQLDLSAIPEKDEYTLRVDRSVTVNPSRLQQLVCRYARHYRVGRALFPLTPEQKAERKRIAAEVEQILVGGR